MKRLLCIVALLGIYTVNAQPNVEVGKPLTAWSEGCLDIHLINSGRGECCFYILPDGTTLLVDAGEIVGGKKEVAARPNDQVRPYVTYARYIKYFLPHDKKSIDYCVPSHFHTDHIGSSKCATEKSSVGYRKSGLLALYDEIPYLHILDRAYPTYTEDEYTPELSGQLSEDWGIFVNWGVENRKFSAARFTPGKEQIQLLNNPNQYPDFSIFNICANGFAWGKNALGEGALIGGKPERGGNPASCGFHLKYGKFDYIACGDVSWTSQDMTAFYFRDYVGTGTLDVSKANHHLAHNGWGKLMRAFDFDPQVVLNPCFASNKPHHEPLAYILPRIKAFFASNIHPEIAEANKELIDQITAYGGHIVLRVTNGGDKFYVYMLDDSNFEYTVKSVHGPYSSR